MTELTYSFIASGYCLEQIVPDGSFLEADPSREIEVGRLVAVVLKQQGPFRAFSGSLASNEMLGVTKIYLGTTTTNAGEAVHLLGMLNPPTVVAVPERYLEAMHLIVGGAVSPMAPEEDDEAGLAAAFDLLSPFIRTGTAQPVGSDWRPPQ